MLAVVTFFGIKSGATKNAQQSAHLTLGILRTSQAVSHALSFFPGLSSRTGWLDGFAVPALAQVSPTGTMAQAAGRFLARDKVENK